MWSSLPIARSAIFSPIHSLPAVRCCHAHVADSFYYAHLQQALAGRLADSFPRLHFVAPSHPSTDSGLWLIGSANPANWLGSWDAPSSAATTLSGLGNHRRLRTRP